MKAEDIFDDTALKLLSEAVASAESSTSAEIRVHIEDECTIDPVDRAWHIFFKLEMHKTVLRNGVMIYLAVEDQRFAIIGDEEIHKRVGSEFWNALRDAMKDLLIKGDFIEAIKAGLKETGKQLAVHFPRAANDVNELSNEVTLGDIK